MRERIKTILLFSLVLISFFLTQKLWIQLPNEMISVFKTTNEVHSSSFLFSDMIAPSKYLINFNQDNHTLVYDDKYGIWGDSKEHLKNVLDSKSIRLENITEEDYLKYHDERSIVFYFSEKLNTYILAKAWKVKEPNNIADTLPNINYIYIYLGSGDPFFVFIGENTYLKVHADEVDTQLLKDDLVRIEESGDYARYYSIRDTFKSKGNEIYIPFRIENALTVVYVTNELATLSDLEKTQLAEMYLMDRIENIREITESNGSTIFLHKERWLKLNASGYIEYFSPLEEKVKERNLYLSLLSASEFINERTRAQKGMYLAKVEEIEADGSVGFKFTFKYRIRGIPVILGNKDVGEYITMEVFNNHIRSYKHLARKELNMNLTPVADNRKMLTSYEVIDKNDEFLWNKYLEKRNMTKAQFQGDVAEAVFSSIEDITLSYYDPSLKDNQERLIGVWAIQADGSLYAFDAYTGTLVFER